MSYSPFENKNIDEVISEYRDELRTNPLAFGTIIEYRDAIQAYLLQEDHEPLDLHNLPLNEINLVGANLKGCNFSGSNLAQANFNNTLIEDCDFSSAWLLFACFQNTVVNENTNFIDAHAACCSINEEILAMTIGNPEIDPQDGKIRETQNLTPQYR